jgi:uncharacterized alpha-E superfamily protein
MLARVAESLNWMARYIERAEDVTRLLAVNFNALLDTASLDSGPAWEPIVVMNGDAALFHEVYGVTSAQSVIEFLLWHPLNPNAVSACVTRARENARSVRERISSEMWEHVNRLYFLVREVDRAAVLRSPHEFFRAVRDGSQAFQGVTAATMTHDEPYEFIRLGTHLERADKTVRLLEAKYQEVSRLPVGSAETALELLALLRSCSAFEPFRRAPGLNLETNRVVEYLLLSRTFPRAVLFCVNACLQSVERVNEAAASSAGAAGSASGGLEQPRPDHPLRSLGRLSADLEYLNIEDVLGDRMEAYLGALLVRLNAAGADLARSYFNTRVILPDERPKQQQQQQQQG